MMIEIGGLRPSVANQGPACHALGPDPMPGVPNESRAAAARPYFQFREQILF